MDWAKLLAKRTVVAMHELWPMYRLRPQPQALHYGYEKAGLTIHDQPIPWNAESVVVEALVLVRNAAARRKADYQLRLPCQDPYPADHLRRLEGEQHCRVSFRLPVPATTMAAELLYRGQVLGQLTLPRLSREEFVQNLRLQMPTVFTRLGGESVACQTFVSTQSQGLLASAVLASPTSLIPVLDLDLQVEFRSDRAGVATRVPVRLCSTQLAGRSALITVIPQRFPRRIGDWVVSWMTGDQILVHQRLRAISGRHFQRSLRIADTRFVQQDAKGGIKLTRQLLGVDQAARIGPCFLVSSREPGMAGLCKMEIRAQVSGAVKPPVLFEQEVMVTDGPTMVAPGTLDASDLGQVTAFELIVKGQSLGVLSLFPTPSAKFSSEGGFKMPRDFNWSHAADEELNDRLGRLIEGRNPGD